MCGTEYCITVRQQTTPVMGGTAVTAVEVIGTPSRCRISLEALRSFDEHAFTIEGRTIWLGYPKQVGYFVRGVSSEPGPLALDVEKLP